MAAKICETYCAQVPLMYNKYDMIIYLISRKILKNKITIAQGTWKKSAFKLTNITYRSVENN